MDDQQPRPLRFENRWTLQGIITLLLVLIACGNWLFAQSRDSASIPKLQADDIATQQRISTLETKQGYTDGRYAEIIIRLDNLQSTLDHKADKPIGQQ